MHKIQKLKYQQLGQTRLMSFQAVLSFGECVISPAMSAASVKKERLGSSTKGQND